MNPGAKTLFIVCGEPSGEAYAANVARVFHRRYPNARMEGIGSARLAAEGVRLLMDYGEISVVGVTEVVRHLPALVSAMSQAVQRATRPDIAALLLVDFPDFNFRVGKKASARDIPVIYYVPPQIWAWRRARAKVLASFTRGVVVLFPFEEAILKDYGVNAIFAGHPLLEELAPFLDAAPDPSRFGIPDGKRVVGLLPGSRLGEIRSHIPGMKDAALEIAREFHDVHFAIPLASSRFRQIVEKELAGTGLPVTIVESDRHLLFRCMTAAAAASGTATLELALLGVPSVIGYRISAISYHAARRLVKISAIGLPNLVEGTTFLPELIQDDFRPERIARELRILLRDKAHRDSLSERCLSLREKLAGRGPSEAVVDMIAREAGEAWG